MVPGEDAQRLFELALREFAPDWEISAKLVEVTLRDPHHWLSGIGTFGATLRHRTTGTVKVLGRRAGPEEGATFHRGISFVILEAYIERSIDPIWRYLQEIGIAQKVAPRGVAAAKPR